MDLVRLLNIDTWDLLPNSEKRRVAETVEGEMADWLQLLGIESFCVGGLSSEIAQFRHLATGLVLHLIPGGSYLRGSRTSSWTFDKPVCEVAIKPFFIGETPVIQSTWDRFGGRDQRSWHGPFHPIEKVSVEDLSNWLENFEDLRLPSESEWEYAARGKAETKYFWGDEMDARYVWFKDNSGMETQSVEHHRDFRNAFGLIDVLGNVWEWCEDDFLDSYADARTDSIAYRSETAERSHVYRGGAWNSRAPNVVLSNRNGRGVNYRFSMIGFRVAASLRLTGSQ
ncbi:MAG: SUMF1/EgtB/PvdO family nonheme iron enzyme [Planctomycetota bacterium]|nr:SUMF1/EgtB/PvdO family nonheme iron enzyme [Planctomycetota bacterium]